jgi:hypothetical protein
MALARAIAWYGFPKPLALGANTLAWDLNEIDTWVASRPRIVPKGAKPGRKPLSSTVSDDEAANAGLREGKAFA